MALIDCPNCGKAISDKSEKCISCGCLLNATDEQHDSQGEEELDCRICPDCGSRIFDERAASCPTCGCPVEKDEAQIKAEISAQKKKKIGIAVAAVVAVLALVGVVVAWNVDASAKNEISEYNDYVDKYNYALSVMVDGGANAENLTNDVKRIWQSAIFDKKSEWDSDIKEYYSDDFNEALALYYADSSTVGTVSSIEENQSEASEAISALQGAPSDFDNAYATISSLYSDYSKLTNLAVSPSGNITSYSESVNGAIDSFMSNYDMAQTQIPGKR